MAHGEDKKHALRNLFVFDKLNLEQAAKQLNISAPTARRWKAQALEQGDNWEKLRSAHTLAGNDLEDVARSLLTDLVLQFKTTMDALSNDVMLDAKERVALLTSLSDSYNKAISANKKLLPETNKLAIALQVVELLAQYIKENKNELLMPFMEVLEPFGKRLEKDLKS